MNFLFFITLGHDMNWISSNPRTVLKETLCTLNWINNRNDMPNNFWFESIQNLWFSSKIKWEKIAFEDIQALFRLRELPVPSVTGVLLQNFAYARPNTSQGISFILTMILCQCA